MKFMSFLSLSLISSLLLIQSFGVGVHPVRLLNLYNHFQYHNSAQGDNFLSYMSKHYGDKSEQHQSSDSSHGELPTKSQLEHHSQVVIFQPTDMTSLSFKYPLNRCFHEAENLKGRHQNNIFEPPKQS
jgi:hypothetical protein